MGQISATPPTNGTQTALTPQALHACGLVMGIGSTRASLASVLGMSVMGWLPQPVKTMVDKWNNSSANEFPAIGAWVSRTLSARCVSIQMAMSSAHKIQYFDAFRMPLNILNIFHQGENGHFNGRSQTLTSAYKKKKNT